MCDHQSNNPYVYSSTLKRGVGANKIQSARPNALFPASPPYHPFLAWSRKHEFAIAPCTVQYMLLIVTEARRDIIIFYEWLSPGSAIAITLANGLVLPLAVLVFLRALTP